MSIFTDICGAKTFPECSNMVGQALLPWAAAAAVGVGAIYVLAQHALGLSHKRERQIDHAEHAQTASNRFQLLSAIIIISSIAATAVLIAKATIAAPVLGAIWLSAASAMALNWVVHRAAYTFDGTPLK